MKKKNSFQVVAPYCALFFLSAQTAFSQSADSQIEADLAIADAPSETADESNSMGDMNPTEVAAVVPLATPAEPAPPLRRIDLKTPYSLQDCIDLIENGIDLLVETRGEISSAEKLLMKDLLDAVADYLEERDDLHSNLRGYGWKEVGRHQVRNTNNKTNTYIFRDEKVPRNVTALSFRVERADSVLERVEVYNQDNQLVGPWSSEMVLRHSFPRRYVYHLYRPTDIHTIRITASQLKPDLNRTPQITVLVGRSDDEEHGKLAIYSVIEAEKYLAEANVKDALESLQKAKQEIRTFSMQRTSR